MAHLYPIGVFESATVSGIAAYSLGGAAAGHRTFATKLSVGDTCVYRAQISGGAWEIGTGTLTNATTLARTLIESSTGALISWPASTVVDLYAIDPPGSYVRRDGDSMTGPLVSPTVIAGGNLVSRASGGEGGQIVLAYAGNTTAAGQSSSTWNLDVDATNGLRVFRQNASNSVTVPLSIAEGDGRISINTNLTVSGTAPVINMVQDGTGAVTRNLVTKLKAAVSPEDFGAVGDGVADDTLAWQRAAATGRTVRVERSTAVYKITGRIRVAAQRQKIDCGHAKLVLSGTDAGFQFQTTDGTYLDSATLENLFFDAIGTTAGTLIIARRNARLSLRNIMGYNPWNFLYVDGTNVCSMTNCWINEVRGDYGIRWYGHTNAVDWGNGQTDTWLRNDVLRLANCTLSTDDKRANNQTVGIDWDGNCHSLATQSLILVGFKHAILVRNTSSSTQVPSFGMFDNLECDFAYDTSIRIEAGNNFHFAPTTYIHGSKTGSGIYIGPDVWNETVVISGGKITGHARYGIEQPSGRCKLMNVSFSSSTSGVSDNALGNTSSETYVAAARVDLDSQFYATRNNGVPTISFDQNDYLSYDRAGNALNVTIAGTRIASFKDQRLYTSRVDWNANFYADGTGTNPIIAFDGNDYFNYDRSLNRLDLIVGGIVLPIGAQ